MTSHKEIQEKKEAFKEQFDFNTSIPDHLIERAALNPLLAHHLYVINGNDQMLNLLIERESNKPLLKSRKSEQLILTGLKSLIKWGSSGFKQISEKQFLKRWKTCQQCPHLTTTNENQLIYDIANKLVNKQGDKRVCGLCGCIGIQKAKIITENCPDEDQMNPGYSRWGEKIR